MDIDTSISDVLREVIKFLECLHDVQLPVAQEDLRQKLVLVLKNKLTTLSRGSPEPYLDMAPGPKSLLFPKKSENDLEDYVEPSQNQIDQNYYERVGNNSQTVAPVAHESSERNDDQNDERNQRFVEIYKNLSAAQAKSKCHKCGPLHRKEGKKLFLSESRACWIALVGSHLLIYRSEKTSRPYAIYPVRNYMARPAPNLLPRDKQRSESAFEIYSPGSETLQFIARTPKDMDQWIAKICEGRQRDDGNEMIMAEVCKRKRSAEFEISSDETMTLDAKKSTADKLITDASDKRELEQKDKDENPPPLPTRIPRRLPSLPSDNAIAPCKATGSKDDDDEEEEIYHKIEDLRNGTCYQNVAMSTKQSSDVDEEKCETYDDICSSKKNNKEQVFPQDKSRDMTPPEEEDLYDDIGTISRTECAAAVFPVQQVLKKDRPVVNDGKKQEEFYDDVENLISNEKLGKDRGKNQTEASKCLQKKSFLERVLSKKESSGKSDKRCKNKVSSLPSSPTSEKMPNDTPDANQDSSTDERKELSEYNCLPPPRPIYTRSLNNPNQLEEFYDDVGANREQCDKSNQQTIPQSMLKREAKENMNSGTCNVEAKDEFLPQEDTLHYQSPRSDLRVCDVAEIQLNEEQLYDDIALWADFTTRQRNNIGKKDGEDAKSIIAPDKKSWNRFVVNKKLRASDSNCSEVTRRRDGESEESEDSSENNGAIKKNTFQRLISRMENSLAKVSARNSTSLSPGQSASSNS